MQTPELATALSSVKGMQDALKTLEAAALASAPFKVKDAVKWKEGDKERIGRVTCLYFNKEKGHLWGKVQANDRWSIGWSSTCFYFSDEEGYKIKVKDLIPIADFDPDPIIEQKDTLEGEIYELEREIEKLTAPLKKQIEGKQSALVKLQNGPCIHLWGEWEETGEVKKHLVGETDVKECVCEICGAKGRNC